MKPIGRMARSLAGERRGVRIPSSTDMKARAMTANLMWRTLLFFALTLGYATLSALPYLT